MNQTIEKTTLSNLVFNEDYCRKVLPFIKPDYFDIKEERVVFEEIINFVDNIENVFFIHEVGHYNELCFL